MERLATSDDQIGAGRSFHHFVVVSIMVFAIFGYQDIDRSYFQRCFSCFICYFIMFFFVFVKTDTEKSDYLSPMF